MTQGVREVGTAFNVGPAAYGSTGEKGATGVCVRESWGMTHQMATYASNSPFDSSSTQGIHPIGRRRRATGAITRQKSRPIDLSFAGTGISTQRLSLQTAVLASEQRADQTDFSVE